MTEQPPVSPTDSSAAVKMTAPESTRPKLVKIRTIHPIAIGIGDKAKTYGPGQIVEVSEEDAREFADKIFVNNYSHSGEHSERFAESQRHRLKRAERV